MVTTAIAMAFGLVLVAALAIYGLAKGLASMFHVPARASFIADGPRNKGHKGRHRRKKVPRQEGGDGGLSPDTRRRWGEGLLIGAVPFPPPPAKVQ